MATLATMRDLDVWYARMDIEKVLGEIGDELGLEPKGRKGADKGMAKVKSRADKALAKARTRDSMQALEKLTEVVDGETRFVSDPPLLVPIEELEPGLGSSRITEMFHEMFRRYRSTLQSDRQHLLNQFRFVTIARKVVGVGSVGTRAWVLLLVGSDGTRPPAPAGQGGPGVGAGRVRGQEPLRQPGGAGGGRPAPHAGLQRHLPGLGPGGRPRRRAAGLLHPSAPGLEGLGRHRPDGARRAWASTDGCAVGPWPGPMPGPATGSPSPPTWARAKTFDNAMVTFAETYADQNERDYDALQQAAAEGRITVESGL